MNDIFSNLRVTVFAACIGVILSAVVMLELCGITEIAFAQGPESPSRVQDEKEARSLEVGKPIERELAGGQAHYFRITAEAGQYLHLIVEQRGIDVVVALYGPEEKKLIEVDSPNGANGPEPVSVIADVSSSYRLEVRSLEKDAAAGRYEVRIADLRTATAQDHSRVMAEKAYADGSLLESQGKAESLRKAIEKYEEALRLYRIAGDRRREGDTLQRIGFILNRFGENLKALDYYNQALPITRALGDRRGEVTTLNNNGLVYDSLGEKQKALDYLNQALTLTRAIGDGSGEAATLHSIGLVYDSLGEKQKALDYYNQALTLTRAGGYRGGEATTLNNIGGVYDSLGEKQKALNYFNQALLLSRAVDARRVEATTLNNIGLVYDSLGEKQKALDYYNQALTLCLAVDDRGEEATTLNNIGGVYDQLGDKQKALDYYNQALPLGRAVGDRSGEARTLLGMARAASAQGKLLDAREQIESALDIIESLRTKVVSPELRSSYFATTQDYEETESLASRDLPRAIREVMGEETGIARLPFSRTEAEAILSVTPKAESFKALDFKASRATATSDELSQYRIVHFATHGLLNKQHPELSGVVLSLVDDEGRRQDGILQLADIYNLNLPAEMVVLSACQTGLGKSVRGEGLVGLTRGFMYAGSKRVVASLWNVQDQATAELMKRFYGRMMGERQMRPAEALRAAQVEMWRQKRWRSPYYWGGFMLYGEW